MFKSNHVLLFSFHDGYLLHQEIDINQFYDLMKTLFDFYFIDLYITRLRLNILKKINTHNNIRVKVFRKVKNQAVK